MKKTPKEQAIEFIHAMRATPTDALQAHIQQVVGEDLADFLVTYGRMALETSGPEVLSGMVLLGYLIRAREDRERSVPMTVFGKSAKA